VRRGGVTAYQLDDASGGCWSHLPAPKNQRPIKSVSNKWQYRHKLQGNSWMGIGCYYSITPPQLEHGANFGLTAFVTTLYHNIILGRLLISTENIFRHSDRGPDNMNQTTHAAHVMLVREGVFQKMWWGGGEAGHSHNKQDKYHYDAKCTYYPGAKGKGPGCNAPFDFYKTLENSSRLQKLDGGMKECRPLTAYCRPLTAYCRSHCLLQVLHQNANFAWVALLARHISSRFDNYASERREHSSNSSCEPARAHLAP